METKERIVAGVVQIVAALISESWCWYATSWEEIKEQWALSMSVAETVAIREMKEGCP